MSTAGAYRSELELLPTAADSADTLAEGMRHSLENPDPADRSTPGRRRVLRRVMRHRAIFAALAGTITTGLWLAMFTIGLSVPTQAYRDRLMSMNPASQAGAPDLWETLCSLIVIGFAYTPTNLAILCCAAALVGCLGRLATTNDAEAHAATLKSEDPGTGRTLEVTATAVATSPSTMAISPLAPAITAVTWGLFIYLIVISGTVVVAGDPFKATSPEQYLRLAGTSSLLAFVVGWRPQFIADLVMRAGAMLPTGGDKKQ